MNETAAIAVGTGVLVLTVVGSFLIGSIPWGYLIGRFIYHTDLRKHGSGNIGAMNALRALGKKGAVAVLLLDAAKGMVPVLLVTVAMPRIIVHFGSTYFVAHASPALACIAAALAVLGHCFSPWLGWKGGKGVATAFGAIFALCWPAGLVVVAVWILGALVLTRFSSVGSMLGAIAAPFALFFFTRSVPETMFGVFAALLILWTHRENIVRLRRGTEGPIRLFDRS
ncbi:MAG TPA: glycerol-3-phosphate 1-O-acyltransferase PlsY [Candidatus Baltobacteraceae bacterium]|nr:glycerol-3-phosphate 1-O-acyltransferase PlsY [Candidatus Baltobacteraceae bacterium]